MPTPPILSQLRRQFSFRSNRPGKSPPCESQNSCATPKIVQHPSVPNISFSGDTFADDISLFDAIRVQLDDSQGALDPPEINYDRISPLLPSPPPRIERPAKEVSSLHMRPELAATPPAYVHPALAAWLNSPDLDMDERALREDISAQMTEISLGDEIYLSIACLSLEVLSKLTTLPEKLVVCAGFCVDETSSLLFLPDFLRVSGTLDIKKNQCLCRLPYALFVEGDLILGSDTQSAARGLSHFSPGHSAASSFYLPSRRASCDEQTISYEIALALGAHLTVLQDLTIRANVAPIALPSSLAVGGSICIQNAKLLRCRGLPPSVGQNVILSGLEQSESLFDAWLIAGSLTITGAAHLKELPAGLSIGGRCEISGAWSLEYIAPDAEFFGDLCLSELFVMETLPPALMVGRDLHLERAYALGAVPDRLTVGRNLRLTDASALRRFGRSVRVGKDFVLCRAPLLVTLPNLLVGGRAVFLECSALERFGPAQLFPQGLQLAGALVLVGFPATLKVREELFIESCPVLERLEGDFVLTTLSISDAPRIVALPASIELTTNLTLRALADFTTLTVSKPLKGNVTLIDLPALSKFDLKAMAVGGRLLMLQCPRVVSSDSAMKAPIQSRELSKTEMDQYQGLGSAESSPRTNE